jgi:hypothetical protein
MPSTGQWLCMVVYIIAYTYIRPFKIVNKGDGRPGVEVENNGKTQQYVRTHAMLQFMHA